MDSSRLRALGWIACATVVSGCVLGYDYGDYERAEGSTGGMAGAAGTSGGSGGTSGGTSGGGTSATGGTLPSGGGSATGGAPTGGGGSTGGGGTATGGSAGSGGSGGACDTSGCGPAGPCFTWTCDSGPCTKKNATAGTPCGQLCFGTTETTSTCDGAGNCVGQLDDCTPYVCDASSDKCRTTCSSPNDCAPSHTCGGTSCQDCVSCGDWLAGEQGTPCPGGTGCAQWSNLSKDCCTAATCQAECSGSGDLCATGNTQCYSSSPPSGACQACLQAKSPCLSYLTLCQQDSGH